MSTTLNLSQSLSMPNLPGMSPNRKSWIHRETSGEGFRRTAAVSRPSSALAASGSAAQCFAGQTGELPRTFSFTHTQANTHTHTQRPMTAQPHSRSQRGVSSLGIAAQSNNNQWEREPSPMAALATRPSTAHAALGRPPSSATLYGATRVDLPVKLPRYVETDKQVLRFYAHFYMVRPFDRDGPLGESTVESVLCRKFIVYFYLFDETLEIFEPRETNSGLPQGCFFKRGRCVNDDTQQAVVVQDLAPGNRVNMLGQEFVVTDADAFTRDFFRRQYDIILPPPLTEPELAPTDCGAMYATGLGSPSPSPSPSAHNFNTFSPSGSRPTTAMSSSSQRMKKNHNACSTDYLTTKEGLDKTQRFLQYDGQVLRFLCVEVSSLSPPYFPQLEEELLEQGEDLYTLSNGHGFIVSSTAKRYALSFYLASLELDLLVQRERENSEQTRLLKGAGKGRDKERQSADEPLTILKRGRLAKNWRDAQRTRSNISPQFYEAEDLHCGDVIDVYGRLFLLCSCDAFTHDVYRERGILQNEVPIVNEKEKVVQQPVPQRGDGFLAIGSAEDTLATVYGMPKVRKDYAKISRNQGRMLRAKAQMVTNNPIDMTREFFLSFYLEDDTLQVFEEVKRNSGIWGGNFLKRGKYFNDFPHDSLTPRPVRATDIFLGNTITVNGTLFRVTEMDNLSLSFCESFPTEFPLANIDRIVSALLHRVRERRQDVRVAFQARDRAGTLSLSAEDFVSVLESEELSDSLTDQEILTLMRRFTSTQQSDARRDRESVFYLELCDMISHQNYVQFLRGRPQTATRVSESAAFNAFLANVRSRSVQWRRLCRMEAESSKGNVTLSQLAKIFQKNGVTLNDSIAKEIVGRYSKGAKSNANELDEIVSARASLKSQSSVRRAMEKASNMAAKISSLRKTNTLSGTNQLKANKAWSVAPNAQSAQPDALIDFHRLCDDIYVCDWI